MSETDDEWEKVREMVRNSPPGTVQTKWTPQAPAIAPEATRNRPPTKVWLMVILLGVGAAGGYVAYNHLTATADGDGAKVEASRDGDKRVATSDASRVAIAPLPEAKPATEPTPAQIKKGTRSVNVRSGPSASTAVVGKLSDADRAEKIGEEGPWTKLRFTQGSKSIEGWVRKDLLEP